MMHYPAVRSCATMRSGRLVTAVIFDLVLVNRTAVSSIRATPDSAYCLAGQGVVGSRANRSGAAALYNYQVD
jgi:hypothetical protein